MLVCPWDVGIASASLNPPGIVTTKLCIGVRNRMEWGQVPPIESSWGGGGIPPYPGHWMIMPKLLAGHLKNRSEDQFSS